jgi:putative ABC transport system ATP-binding protein
MENIIKANGIKRCFKVAGEDFYALKGIDISVPKGALTILKGRSGSGKTTLLNIIGCLDKQTEGTLELDNVDITDYSYSQLEKIRRKELGFIFQSVALIPVMSAYQNVEYALRLSDYKGDRDERVKECLEMVNLSKRATHMPEELSGGEQQRVAIARAIAHKPKVIFADEPTGELDSYTSQKVIKLFKTLIAKEGLTIVMTTHDPRMMEYGDCVYEILDGEIINYKNNLEGGAVNE